VQTKTLFNILFKRRIMAVVNLFSEIRQILPIIFD
jgi:hypothetical protein